MLKVKLKMLLMKRVKKGGLKMENAKEWKDYSVGMVGFMDSLKEITNNIIISRKM